MAKISFDVYNNCRLEYSIKEDVLTKTERNLENMQNTYYKEYKSIIINGKNIILKKPLVFLIEQNKEGYYFTNTDLNIIAGGKSFEMAEKNMYDEFLIQWGLYASEEDYKLTTRAQEIKNNLIESIKL